MDQTRRAVTILGAGTQGTRLAYMWTSRGRPVYLIDKDEKQLERAKRGVETLRSQAQSSSTTSGECGEVITSSTDGLPEAASKSWMLLECLPESLKLKRTIVKELDELADAEMIIASNSSSYTIEEILEDQTLKQPDRFTSLHCCMTL
ncbi:hypothetical protein LTR10_023895 [Elasticomyces elasticus]|uniref:3-hydroxyacyl-CoA dehydrogenase NAD binding domain-containing protein n=1 Tax=Exophiala sideris TaxID=1016849 RepID=A0ABR0IZ96_9EURO|nr:hypothetical protein LTR10_023895 [Elasticomyces elasticus]KAK5022669.1 hypothetical protein LTS07_009892 [Exophiala sideris]KAK5052245.1 hypothetical protein LTR69_010007 [Exophiala sideris]